MSPEPSGSLECQLFDLCVSNVVKDELRGTQGIVTKSLVDQAAHNIILEKSLKPRSKYTTHSFAFTSVVSLI